MSVVGWAAVVIGGIAQLGETAVRFVPACTERGLAPLCAEKRTAALSGLSGEAALGMSQVELAQRAEQGVGGNADLTIAVCSLTVDLRGQEVGQAVAQSAAGGRIRLVFCGTDAVVAADIACFKRPFVKAFGQQAAAAVKRHIDDDGTP